MSEEKNFKFLERLEHILNKFISYLEIIPERLEKAAEDILKLMSKAVSTIYRFLRDMLIISVKTGWRILQIFVFLLVPGYMASFGHELILGASNWFFYTLGYFLLGVGILLIFLILVIILVSFAKQPELHETSHGSIGIKAGRQPKGIVLLLIDMLAIGVVIGWLYIRPDYHFQSPLLHITQKFYEFITPLLALLLRKLRFISQSP